MKRKNKYLIGLYILAASFMISGIFISGILFGDVGIPAAYIGMFSVVLYYITAQTLEKIMGIKND